MTHTQKMVARNFNLVQTAVAFCGDALDRLEEKIELNLVGIILSLWDEITGPLSSSFGILQLPEFLF